MGKITKLGRALWVLVTIGVLAACSAPDATSELDPTIIGGEEASPNEFPFMVHLNGNGDIGGSYCGASILSATWVVTAAHCMEGEDVVYVVAGDHQLSRDESEQVVRVETITEHEQWTGSVGDGFDIAVLELTTPLELNDVVQPIGYAETMPAAGTALTAAGWGDTGDGGSDILKKVELILDDEENGCNFEIETAFCTVVDASRDTGVGDSGGPLFLDNALIGLTSFGTSGSGDGPVGYYAKVPALATWIEGKTGIAPNGGGETEPEPEPEPEPDTYAGDLDEGETALQPDGTFFRSDAGIHSASLEGPETANFDLYLYKWGGGSWEFAARGTSPDSLEELSYEGEAGFYSWLVYARTGGGDYSLTIERP